jgi:ribonuclease Y
MPWIIGLVALATGIALGLMFGHQRAMKSAHGHHQKRVREGEEKLGAARREADTILHEARLEAEEVRSRELEKLEEKEQRQQERLKERELQLKEREQTVEKKRELVSSREVDAKHREQLLENRQQKLAQSEARVEEIINQQNEKLQAIARLSTEEAREQLFRNLERKVQQEAAKHVNEIREQARLFATQEARQILVNAMERTAVEQSAQSTVTLFELPSDEIKGRIIGREGRNIRSFEAVTGVELLVDDTPRTVLLSSFDPMRREIAKLSLESLINDGRIHPARIEEVVERVREEMVDTIRRTGEQAMLDLGVHGLHPELIRHLGILAYRNTQGQNLLAHSREVASIAGILATELGLDPRRVRRAALLHDVGRAVEGYTEADACNVGADLVRKFGEAQDIEDAIRFIREGEETRSLMATLINVANKVSLSRPGIRGEHMGRYIQRLTQIEEIARENGGVSEAFVLQAGRELRVVVDPAQVPEDQLEALAGEIAGEIQQRVLYPGQIRVTAVREFRSLELAK